MKRMLKYIQLETLDRGSRKSSGAMQSLSISLRLVT